MANRSAATSPDASVPDQSRTKSALQKHFDTLVTVGISLGIFGAAYVVRILPQLQNIDSQMESIHGQLGAVNDSLARIGDDELLRLQLSAHGLQQKLDALDEDAAATDAELQGGSSETAELRKKLTELRAGTDELTRALAMTSAQLAPDAGPLPDVREAARNLASQLDEARALLAPEGKAFPKLYEEADALARTLHEAEEHAKGPFPDLQGKAASLAKEMEKSQETLAAVHAQADQLAQKLAEARTADEVVPCAQIADRKTLAALRKKGFCVK